MISLHIQDSHIFENYTSQIQKAHQNFSHLYTNGSVLFPDVDVLVEREKIEAFARERQWKYDSIVLLWIGGSALGVRAILDAVKGKYYNNLSTPKLFICDNVDPGEISDIVSAIDISKTFFFVISKSGSTLETLSVYEFFKERVQEAGLPFWDHFVVITGENSKLHKEAASQGIEYFFLEENIGGRFSVLTYIWLLPLSLLGVDVCALLDGVTHVKKRFLSSDIQENTALQSALVQFDAYQSNIENTVFFPYASNLKSLWFWYKQLFWESLGKNNIPANLFVSVGTTDQHSDLQLFVEGKNDKLFLFLEVENFRHNPKVLRDEAITFWDILGISCYGTKKALTQKWRKNSTISLENLLEQTIGALIVFFEFQVAYLGELLGINAYDQPGVEASKKISKQKLQEKFISSKLF